MVFLHPHGLQVNARMRREFVWNQGTFCPVGASVVVGNAYTG